MADLIIAGNNDTVVIDNKKDVTVNKTVNIIKTSAKPRTKNDIIIANQELIINKLNIILAENNLIEAD